MSKRKISIPKNTRFEDAMAELETVVQKLEAGEQSLETSLQEFERGIALTRFCQQALSDAEAKVQILLQEEGTTTLVDLKNSPEQ